MSDCITRPRANTMKIPAAVPKVARSAALTGDGSLAATADESIRNVDWSDYPSHPLDRRDRRLLSAEGQEERTEVVSMMLGDGLPVRTIAKKTGLSKGVIQTEIARIRGVEAGTDDVGDTGVVVPVDTELQYTAAEELQNTAEPDPSQDTIGTETAAPWPTQPVADGVTELDVPDVADESVPTKPAPGKSWRDVIKVHPAADVFPLMSADELTELGNDIKANGLQHPPSMWMNTHDSCKVYLLDGRNRLDAMEMAGIPVINKDGGLLQQRFVHPSVDNVGAVVVSLNIKRRHLTPIQRATLAAKVLLADEEFMARCLATIGEAAKEEPQVTPTADVSAVGRNERGQVTKGSASPNRSIVADVAASADVSRDTARKAVNEAKRQAEPCLFGGVPDLGAEQIDLSLRSNGSAPRKEPPPPPPTTPDEDVAPADAAETEAAESTPAKGAPPAAPRKARERAGMRKVVESLVISINSFVSVLDDTDPAEIDGDYHRDDFEAILQGMTRVRRFINEVAKQGNVVQLKDRAS